MSENIIYCYSGSGHSLNMAESIAHVPGDTDIVLMRSFPSKTDARDAKRVGFVFPCYGAEVQYCSLPVAGAMPKSSSATRLLRGHLELPSGQARFREHQVHKLCSLGIRDIMAAGYENAPEGCRFA